MGENICKSYDQQRVNIKNIQTAHTAQYQKTNDQIQKWAEDLNRHFFQRRHTDGQQAHEKMLNIANY